MIPRVGAKLRLALQGVVLLAACLPALAAAPWPVAALGEVGEICGDSALKNEENCDDGNAADGDGCSRHCRIEAGWECTDPIAPILASNAVPDGSFEAGTPSPVWTETGVLSPLCSGATCGLPFATDGDWFAWFGGIEGEHTQSLSQSVVIPSGSLTLELEYWPERCDSNDDVLEVRLDGNVVFTSDPCTKSGSYLYQVVDLAAAPGGPYDDDASHNLIIEGRFFSTNGTVSNFFIDDVGIYRPLDPPIPGVPSECTQVAEACFFEEFEDHLAGWSRLHAGELPVDWGTIDDGICGSNDVIPWNFTDGAGISTCIDSDAAGPGIVDAALCSPVIDLSRSENPLLRVRTNYQVFNTSLEDRFAILAGRNPPSPQTIPNYVTLFETFSQLGIRFGAGETLEIPLTIAQGEPRVWICFRYTADFDLYAQVDDVQILGTSCADLALQIGGTCPGQGTIDLFGATPHGNVAVVRGAGPGTSEIPTGRCRGTKLNLASPTLLTTLRADAAGRILSKPTFNPGLCGAYVQFVDLGSCLVSRPSTVPGEIAPRARR